MDALLSPRSTRHTRRYTLAHGFVGIGVIEAEPDQMRRNETTFTALEIDRACPTSPLGRIERLKRKVRLGILVRAVDDERPGIDRSIGDVLVSIDDARFRGTDTRHEAFDALAEGRPLRLRPGQSRTRRLGNARYAHGAEVLEVTRIDHLRDVHENLARAFAARDIEELAEHSYARMDQSPTDACQLRIVFHVASYIVNGA